MEWLNVRGELKYSKISFGVEVDFTRMWGFYLEDFWLWRISWVYGVIYLITSLPKVFPSVSFADPSSVTLYVFPDVNGLLSTE